MRSTNFRLRTLAFIAFAALFFIWGCKRREKANSSFEQEPSTYVLLVAIGEKEAKDPNAYRFLLRTIDRYFNDRIGEKDQVIIARIEGVRPLVWQGTPRRLRKEFPTPEAFRDAVITSEREPGSLYEGLARSMNLLLKSYSIAKGKATGVTVVLSSMIDPQPSAESQEKFIQTLIPYWQEHHEIGFYYVDQLKFDEIEEVTKKAGMSWVYKEPDVNGDPPLPTFQSRPRR